MASVDILGELNAAHKENSRYRDLIGNLEIALTLPALPEATDLIDLDLIPLETYRHRVRYMGTSATVRTTWIDVFATFHDFLEWRTEEWQGDYAIYIDEEKSCV